MAGLPNIEPGQVYGRLQVLTPPAFKKGFGRYALCQCLCGSGVIREIRTAFLVSGATAGCGCLRQERANASNTTHGGSKTEAYKSWRKMRARCLDSTNVHFARYGGRGIKICDRWMNFADFFADLGERSIGMTLERIDNDGDYEPSNCKWASRKEQGRNTSANRLSVAAVLDLKARFAGGESQMSMAKSLGVSYGAVWHALHGYTWTDVSEA